jgi:signal transduction histidine kinase
MSESERVRAARAAALERQRRNIAVLRPIGLAMMALIIVPALGAAPGPGLSGRGLAVSVALAAFTLAMLAVVSRRDTSDRARIALLLVITAAGTALTALQTNGAGELTVGLVTWTAAARLPLRTGVALSAVAAVALSAASASRGNHAFLNIASTLLLAALLYIVALSIRRTREDHLRTEVLLAELQDAREAEARATAEAERARIARELHDVLAHSLAGLSIQLEGARLLAERRGADPEIADAIARAKALSVDGLAEARRAVRALRGDDVPGPEGLPALVHDFERDAGIAVDYAVEGEPRRLEPDAALAIYRAAQEALTNVARHSGAARAAVRLRYDPDATRLVVEDEGPAQPSDVGSGSGLSAMRERAALLSGTVQAGAYNGGFRVEVSLPA